VGWGNLRAATGTSRRSNPWWHEDAL